MGKPLFENVGIGMIIKRIGECNAIVNDYTLSTLLTQQTPREEECRDICITAGSKIVIIDFKAPDVDSQGVRNYDLKTKVTRLAVRIGSRNFFFGLLHATLTSMPPSDRGYYLAIAVPATTRFLSLEQLGVNDSILQQKVNKVLNLGKLRVRSVYTRSSRLNSIYCNEDRVVSEAQVPSCIFMRLLDYYYVTLGAKLCSIIEFIAPCSRTCVSCGSLCVAQVSGELNGQQLRRVQVISLAALLWKLRCCRIGYQVSDEEARWIREEIARAAGISAYEPDIQHNMYVLAYTPGFGFSIIPLGPGCSSNKYECK